MSGFSTTIIEAPEHLAVSGLKIPSDHLRACKAYPMGIAGNAAGNTQNPLNLNGSNTAISSSDYGYVMYVLITRLVLTL